MQKTNKLIDIKIYYRGYKFALEKNVYPALRYATMYLFSEENDLYPVKYYYYNYFHFF